MPPAALITGAASGLGRFIATALAAKGYDLTLLDLDVEGVQETASLAQLAGSHSSDTPAGSSGSSGSSSSTSLSIQLYAERLDVSNAAAQSQAFRQHMLRFGRLDFACLSAGIGERGLFFDAGNADWEKTMDIDLSAVLHGIRNAVFCMRECGTKGCVLSVASAGGIFPMPVAPVYAAAKAGLVHFTRSCGGSLFRSDGIRVMTLCPEFVDTPMVRLQMECDPVQAKRLLGSLDITLLQPQDIAQVAIAMLVDAQQYKAGTVLLVRQDGRLVQPYKNASGQLGASPASPSSSTAGRINAASVSSSKVIGTAPTALGAADKQALASWATRNLPTSYRKVVVHKLSTSFTEATRLVTAPLPATPPPGQVLVRVVYAGINASDINYTSGRYHASTAEAQSQLPFDCGFELVGVVAACGQGVSGFAVGDPIAALTYGGFSEFLLLPAKSALPVPAPAPETVALLTSGLTASIALEELGHMKQGETVLVTAAAGGTGMFAVQLAKLAGCKVIATCGGPAKRRMLEGLGADRVIDYKSEDLQTVLKKEYPKGVDVVYESVGGSMFSAALNGLAPRGRLIVIGMMSQYEEGWPPSNIPGLAEKLLWKSASVSGFFLLRYAPLFRTHLARLAALQAAGKLRVHLDSVPFIGVEAVADAVARLQSGASAGKVVVQIAKALPPQVGLANAQSRL